MSPVHVVMMKELVDLARDRRTVLISLLMGPLLIVALVVGMVITMKTYWVALLVRPGVRKTD